MNMPFWKNTGYFGLYVHPPYAKHSPFGDNLDVVPNIENYYVMNYFAKHTDNPLLPVVYQAAQGCYAFWNHGFPLV